jgi:hypothetical protein
MKRRIKVNPLDSVLRAALKEVEIINGQLDTLVVTYLRTFLNFHEVLNRSYEIERKLSITNNDLILRWDNHVKGEEIRKYGPYWCWCIFAEFRNKEDGQGRKGRFRYRYIGPTISENDIRDYFGKKGGLDIEEKRKYMKHISNLPLYEVYNRQLSDLREKKAKLMKVVKRLKGLIRYGRTSQLKRKSKKQGNSRSKTTNV